MTTPVAAERSSVRVPLAIRGRLVARRQLLAQERSATLDLLARYFNGVDTETFSHDLAEKNWVILLEDEQGALRGFSTLLLYDACVRGRSLSIVYSGDTIVEPSAWGTTALPRTWIHGIHALRRHSSTQLYWLLLTKGYRTYRFLSVFFRSYYPSVQRPAAAGMRLLTRRFREPTIRFGLRPARGRRPLSSSAGALGGAVQRARGASPRPARGILSRAESGLRVRRRTGLPRVGRGRQSHVRGAARHRFGRPWLAICAQRPRWPTRSGSPAPGRRGPCTLALFAILVRRRRRCSRATCARTPPPRTASHIGSHGSARWKSSGRGFQ